MTALVVLARGIGLLALGVLLLVLHRRRWRNGKSFGLRRMNDAMYAVFAVPVLLLALIACVDGASEIVRDVLRARAVTFASGLKLACTRDWIDISNPSDVEGWVRIEDIDGNGAQIVLSLDDPSFRPRDTSRRAYPKPETPFWMGARTTRHVTLSLPSHAVCGPKAAGGSGIVQGVTMFQLFDLSAFDKPCDTWQVTLVSGLTEERTLRERGDGGVTVDCPIAP